jgi:Raf kinase inhibitor-like YbhB/YbcL family protein
LKRNLPVATGLVLALAAEISACNASAESQNKNMPKTKGGAVKITSELFSNMGDIPVRSTCKGEDVSPALTFSEVPSNAKSLVLIVDDPDAPDPKAPKMTWVHWVLYNLPPDTKGLKEGIKRLPSGTEEGLNDWKQVGWRGPCPPIGRHRYFFKLYALSDTLPAMKSPTKSEVLFAMEGKIIAEAELIGTYQK